MTYSTSNSGIQLVNQKIESKKISSFNIPNFFSDKKSVNNEIKVEKTKNKVKK